MNVYTEIQHHQYERVVRCDNRDVGFTAWIAIHNSALGPALGGCRIWQYESDDAALTDALRLSRGMTYKNALARLPLGGGKSVVNADLKKVDRTSLFKSVGDFVEHLQGAYITAEDVNSTVEDMAIVQSRTRHVATVGASGNPSPFTAFGVYCAIKTAVKHKYHQDSLAGLTVAVQGIGETGARLAKQLRADNCRIIATDINPKNIRRLREKIDFELVEAEAIYNMNCDVFAPCALGGILNNETIPLLRCAIVAGSANNQLLEESDGDKLRERNILYAPDYAANAGGVINISCEIGQDYKPEKAKLLTSRISATLEEIFIRADRMQLPTNIVANRMAEEIIAAKSAGTGPRTWRPNYISAASPA